jgi:hypothetical protein
LPAAETPVPIELRSSNGRWLVRIATDQPSVVHLGIDTEGTGRETHNLLREPLRLSWMQSTAPLRSWSVERRPDGAVLQHRIDYGQLDWIVRAVGESLEFEIRQDAWAPVYDLALVFNLNQAHCPTAVLPHAVEDHVRLIPPWLFVAPDHGHLYCEPIPGGGAKKTVQKGVSAVTDAPSPWFSTLVGQRRSHTLVWTLRSRRPFEKSDAVTFRFSPQPIAKPDGVDEALWRRVRRPWLNLFQANADENDVETPMMLANNVLSNPAVCCTFFLIMGLDSAGMREDSDWLLEPLLRAAEAGELQNGLHVKAGKGAEHRDWDGNPTGYEGYLPEGWFFLTAALLRQTGKTLMPVWPDAGQRLRATRNPSPP